MTDVNVPLFTPVEAYCWCVVSASCPLRPEDMKHLKCTPQLKIAHRALGLSEEEFAARFQIPLRTLRDWEQNRRASDATRAYLVAIARNPSAVNEALHPTLQ